MIDPFDAFIYACAVLVAGVGIGAYIIMVCVAIKIAS